MLNRRTTLATIGALAVAMASPPLGASAAMPSRRLPPRLKRGDKVGLAAPAAFVADRFGLEELDHVITAMGLKPVHGEHVLERNGYLAGDDRARASDLNRMFADPEIRAIFAVRGGWGVQRMLPYVDWEIVRANPKLVIGYSDITALHLAIAKQAGFTTIHGPNASASWPQDVWEAFRAIAFDASTQTYNMPEMPEAMLGMRGPRARTFGKGKARGRLLGGNLTVLASLVGTPWLPDFTGRLLFLEDIGEAEYRIDRMLTQIGQAGILDACEGVVFGECTRCSNPDGGLGNFTLYEVLDHHLGRLGKPAFQGPRFGHISDNFPLPVGTMAEIDANAGTIRLLEAAVA